MLDEKYTDTLDLAQFYIGYGFKLNDELLVRQPTLDEIIRFGEKEYFALINLLTSIPSDRKSELWDAGVNFSEITHFQYFYLITRSLPPEISVILFNEKLDLSALTLGTNDDGEVLYDENQNVALTDDQYRKLHSYLCTIHAIKKEEELPASKLALLAMIEVDRQEREAAQKTPTKTSGVLFPLLSSMENSAGYKYTAQESLNLPIFHFMDSVRRVSLLNSVLQQSIGYFTGNFDVKKFKPEVALNWTRDLYNT